MDDDPKKDAQKEEKTEEKEEEQAEPTQETVEEKAEPTQEQPKEAVKVEEPKAEPVKPARQEPEPKAMAGGEKKPKARAKPLSVKLEKIVKEVESLSVLELSDLVKALEERFGVTAAAPQVAPSVASAPSGQAAGAEGPAEEQTTFNVILANSGGNKISVIKALREINPQLGLKEAKDIVDAPPKEILTGVNKETAAEAKQKLEAAGAQVELK